MILATVEMPSSVIIFKGHHLFHRTPMDPTHGFTLKAAEIRVWDVIRCMVANLHIHGEDKQITVG
jgi:hypothetical protein